MSQFRIVADTNMPQVESFFAGVADITLLDGRNITHSDLVDANALLVRSVTKVTPELLNGTKVKFVGSATAGLDHIAAEIQNHDTIAFANAAGANARSVVEYDLACFSYLYRRFSWSVFGKTVAVIGYGNVGRRLCEQLLVLGIDVRIYDPLVSVPSELAVQNLQELAACDCICVHAPLTRTGLHPTQNLLSTQFFAAMKPGTVLLSAGRGGIVDEEALKPYLLKESFLFCCDVWAAEPFVDQSLLPLAAIATPHIAGYSSDSKVAATSMLFDAFVQFFQLQSHQTLSSQKQMLEVTVDATLAPQSALFGAIAKAYPIERDDQAFRQQPNGLDSLRANYWQRQEFHNYGVDTSNRELRSLLTSAGFLTR